MNMHVLLGMLAVCLGCALLYLSSSHQKFLRAPLHGPASRTVALGLLVAAFFLFVQAMLVLTACFTVLTLAMLSFTVLPYLGALLNPHRATQK